MTPKANRTLKNTISISIPFCFMDEIFISLESFQFLLDILILRLYFLSLHLQLLYNLTRIRRKYLGIILLPSFSSPFRYLFYPRQRLILKILIHIHTQWPFILHLPFYLLLFWLYLLNQKRFWYRISVLKLSPSPILMAILLLNRFKSVYRRRGLIRRLDPIVPVIIEIVRITILFPYTQIRKMIWLER